MCYVMHEENKRTVNVIFPSETGDDGSDSQQVS